MGEGEGGGGEKWGEGEGEKWGEARRLGVITYVSLMVCTTGQEPENKSNNSTTTIPVSACIQHMPSG